MTKNIKFIAPLALVAFGTLASCGGKASDAFAHLKRVEYNAITGDAATRTKTIIDLLDGIKDAQTAGDEPGGVYFTIPSKGTITFNYSVALKGNVQAIMAGMMPIDVNGIDIGESNSVTVSWTGSSAKDAYMKISSKDDYSYVVYSDNHYWKCYHINDDTKYRINLDEVILKHNNNWQNFVVAETLYNNGLFFKAQKSLAGKIKKFIGAGFGLTGFGNEGYLEGITENPIAPGNWFRSTETLKYIDVVNGFRGKINAAYGSNDSKTFSANLAINKLDLKDDLLDLLKQLIEDLKDLPLEASGLASLDYFVAYANNFIKQHELIVNFDNVKVAFANESSMVNADFNLSAYIGQEYTETDVKPEEVHIDDYVDITPKK